MKKHILPLSLSILMLSSCTKILLYSYGVRNPKIEKKETIETYLEKEKLNNQNLFSLKDTVALQKFNESNIGMPEIRFYDKNGYLMLYRDNKKCNGQNDSLITFLDPTNIIKIDSTQNIFQYIIQLRKLDGNPVDSSEFKDYDFYLIMYWAKWVGKVNSIKMLDWEKSLAAKNDLKIKTIKVTTDYMNFWDIRKKDMAKIYSPRTKLVDKKKERAEENK